MAAGSETAPGGERMRILITGARAPVAIEWARIALRSGHEVWMADSLRHPLGRYLSGVNYVRLPAPKLNIEAYQLTLEQALQQLSIDSIIPTCEEVFYLAPIRDCSGLSVEWMLPNTKLLYRLHNKYHSLSLLSGLADVEIPATRLLQHPSEVKTDANTILKPVYSRFGRRVIRQPQQGCLGDSELNPKQPWVQQQKVQGEALSNYALFDRGRLLLHQAYRPRYCLNQSAGSYFEPYSDQRLEAFVTEFGRRTNYCGQVAFDFIEQQGRLYVIECNPRATSGLHLVGPLLTLQENGDLQQASAPVPARCARAALAIFFALPLLFRGRGRSFVRDYRAADDVLQDGHRPLKKRALWLSFIEVIWRSLSMGKSLTDASTFDIEWDGPDWCDKREQR